MQRHHPPSRESHRGESAAVDRSLLAEGPPSSMVDRDDSYNRGIRLGRAEALLEFLLLFYPSSRKQPILSDTFPGQILLASCILRSVHIFSTVEPLIVLDDSEVASNAT